MLTGEKQIKVVLVDDHSLFRKCLSDFISSEEWNKFHVMFDARNGKDLIDRLDKKDLPDVVLMDIDMPEMDGYETVAWLKEHYPQVHILIVSMIEKEEAIVKMIRLGVKGYLSKDIDPDDLYNALIDVGKGKYHYTKFLTGKLIHSLVGPSGSDKGIEAYSSSERKWNTLTQREKDFVKLACTELIYTEIASRMFVAPKTVDGYRESVFEKLEVKNRIALVLFAIKNGFVRL